MLSCVCICNRMGKIYSFLGLTVGIVQEPDKPKNRRAAFGADITYITSPALGFTYLADTSVAKTMDDLVMSLPCPEAVSGHGIMQGIDTPGSPLLSCQQ